MTWFWPEVPSHNYVKRSVTKSQGYCDLPSSEIDSNCNSLFRPADSN